MKIRLINIVTAPIAACFRVWSRLATPLTRAWNLARARALLPNFSPEARADGGLLITGTANVTVAGGARLGREVELETRGVGSVYIGARVRLNRGVTICSYFRVTLGEGALVGEFTSIRDANHGIEPGRPIKDQDHYGGAVDIGSDAWIGRGCCILAGVTIGNGAVVGANSVVTRDVPPGAVVAGAPARIIRFRNQRSIEQSEVCA